MAMATQSVDSFWMNKTEVMGHAVLQTPGGS